VPEHLDVFFFGSVYVQVHELVHLKSVRLCLASLGFVSSLPACKDQTRVGRVYRAPFDDILAE
jgi:hypothetical protein